MSGDQWYKLGEMLIGGGFTVLVCWLILRATR
jgi:hypothetical protein